MFRPVNMIMLYSSESILFPICIVCHGIVIHFKVGLLVNKNLGKVALPLYANRNKQSLCNRQPVVFPRYSVFLPQ